MSPATLTPEELLADAADVFYEMADTAAGSFTCGETDRILRVIGNVLGAEQAVDFLVCHIEGDDDETDEHHGMTEEQARAHVARLLG